MSDRSDRPNWPRLMCDHVAASYLDMSVSKFRALGIVPLNIGRNVRWDRQSLDTYVDRLAGQPLSPDEREAAQADVERAFLDRRRRA